MLSVEDFLLSFVEIHLNVIKIIDWMWIKPKEKHVNNYQLHNEHDVSDDEIEISDVYCVGSK